ncbi:hypothetical protein RP20_CCG021623 [Aedes albopictus]|nr:hypothetical protein RP20_CCG021623 [Aedes albopictus]
MTYFVGAYTICRVINRTEITINVPINELPIAVVQLPNGMVEAINLGCSVFLIEEDAVFWFLDAFVKIHDAARFRCSMKYFVVTLQSTGRDQLDVLDRVQTHPVLENMPNFLLVVPKVGKFEFITNRFVGNSPMSCEYILLDEYSIESDSFVYGENLFPDKLSDLMGKTIRVASFYLIPWFMMHKADDGLITYQNQSYTADGSDGYFIILFCLRHNCTWELHVDEKNLYGQVFENGSGNGLFGALLDRSVDFAVGGVGSYSKLFPYFSISKPLRRAAVTCLAAKPKLVPYWKFIFIVFSPSIWKMLMITSITLASCLFIANGKSSKSRDKDYLWIFVNVLKSLLLYSTDLNRSNASSVILITSLLIFSLIVGNVYIGQIHSILTLPPYQPSINTVQELITSGLQLIERHPIWMFAIDGSSNPKDQKLMEQFRVTTPEHMTEIVNNGDEAILIVLLESGHTMVSDAFSTQNIKHYRIMSEQLYFEYEIAYATKTWPLLDRIDQLSMWARDACLFQYLEQIMVDRYMNYWVQVAIEHSREMPHVQLKNMVVEEISGALMILVVGLTGSTLAFLLENVVCYSFRYVKQVLMK